MEYLCGKQSRVLLAAEFVARLNAYREVAVDLGTGDGRFVQQLARQQPQRLVIGVDACRENLYAAARQALPNSLYLIANAEQLPAQLNGTANFITVNFPWGSLLTGLLDGNTDLLANLQRLARPEARLEICLNISALQQAGVSSEQGAAKLRCALQQNGFKVSAVQELDALKLRNYPSTWAKRLAYGRLPRALYLRASYQS